MGKIEVEGYAERTVDYDMMEISIGFYEFDISAKEASEEVMSACETFLGTVKKYGVDISKFKLESDSVRAESRYYEDENISGHCASRKLSFAAPFDMKMINNLRSISDKLDLRTSFDVNYKLSDSDSIKEELKLEAVRNAKARAEKIASSIDMKVTGLISADKNDRYSSGGGGEIMCLLQVILMRMDMRIPMN